MMYPKGNNYIYPSVIDTGAHALPLENRSTCIAPRKPPELHYKASINYVKKNIPN